MKRILDLLFSITGLLLLLPLFALIAIWIKAFDGGPVFYYQNRVGKDNVDFKMMKFRSMKAGSDKKGLLTIGSTDARITKPGLYFGVGKGRGTPKPL